VVVWRVPRGESVVHPGSRCPQCHHAIPFYRNIPVVTWLLQRGRCAWCQAPIPVFYVLVEAFCAVLGAAWAMAWGYGIWTDPVRAAGWGVFAFLSVPIALIDWEHFEIPDGLVVAALGGGLVAMVLVALPEDRWDVLLEALRGSLLAGGFLYALLLLSRVGLGWCGSLTRRVLPRGVRWHWRRGWRRDFLQLALRWGRFHPDMEALGLGDVSLGLAAGACLGFPAVLVGLAPAAGLGALAYLYRREHPVHLARASALGIDPLAIPFGPFLCAGFLLAALWIQIGGASS
jgi:prepilin signal peptidase PulO-like enzyme (type II secretory pathway)